MNDSGEGEDVRAITTLGKMSHRSEDEEEEETEAHEH